MNVGEFVSFKIQTQTAVDTKRLCLKAALYTSQTWQLSCENYSATPIFHAICSTNELHPKCLTRRILRDMEHSKSDCSDVLAVSSTASSILYLSSMHDKIKRILDFNVNNTQLKSTLT